MIDYVAVAGTYDYIGNHGGYKCDDNEGFVQ